MFALVAIPILIVIGFMVIVIGKNHTVEYKTSGNKCGLKVTAPEADLRRLQETFRCDISPQKGERNKEHIHIAWKPK